jgi:hypothetical protein
MQRNWVRAVFMSPYRTAGQNYFIKAGDKSFENVAEFKYVEGSNGKKTALTMEIRVH